MLTGQSAPSNPPTEIANVIISRVSLTVKANKTNNIFSTLWFILIFMSCQI